jgi:vitamin B12 transporter
MKTTTFNKRNAIVFKHFNRKGYSLFSALGKVVLIGVLAVPTLAHAKAGGMAAVNEHNDADSLSFGEQRIDEVQVTGSRAPLTAQQSAKIVEVISRDDIRRAEAQTVNDILKLATGVDVRQRGGFGVQTDISINGGTFDQITLLLNGVPLTSPQTGHNAADFPVSLDDIDHIEVIEGAASRVFGSAAFSGAINIVTVNAAKAMTADKKWTGWFRGEGGSFGSFGANAGVGYNDWRQNSAFDSYLSGGYTQSDGGTDNSNFKKRRGYYRGSYTSYYIDVNWQAGISSQDYGANTFYSARFPNQYEWTRRYIGSVSADIRPLSKLTISPMVYAHRDVDHYQLIKDSVGAKNGENYHRMDVYGASLNVNLDWLLGKTSVGADIRKEHILSTAYGDDLGEDDWKKIHGSDRYYIKEGNRTNTSLYLEHNILLGGLTVSAGVMANKNTGLDSDFHFYPGVDISYRPDSHWKFYASWNRAMRLPTFTDMYANNSAQKGDVNLKPERNTSYKIGSRYRTLGFEAILSAFYSHGANMIDWVYETEASKQYHALNISKLNNEGFNIDATINFSELLGTPLQQSETPVKLKLGYAYIHQHSELTQTIYRSLYALEYLRHKFVASLSHPIVSHLSASWSLRWQQRMNGYHPYAKLDGVLQWSEPHYQLYVKADNITGRRYYDIGGVKQPGLWIMAGAKVNL